MTKVKIFKIENDERVKLLYEYNSKKTIDKPFEIRDEILDIQNQKDFLKINKKLNSLGITSISCNDRAIDSFGFDGNESMVHTGRNSCVIGNSARKGFGNDGNDCVYIDDEGVAVPDENLTISFTAYESGLLLGVGKTISSIFVGNKPAYLTKITKKSIFCNSAKDAKLFTTYKSLIEYLTKHRYSLEYAVQEHGYELSILSIYDGAKDSAKEDLVKEVNDLINVINSVGLNPTTRGIPSIIDDEVIKSECIDRLNDFKVMRDVVNNFKNGKLMMSEFGGILYNLNDEAKRAVEIVEGYGYRPYHVVVAPVAGQTTYAVLYTSNISSEWEYERVNPKGQLDSFVYMPEYDQIEHGPIWVVASSGGISRIG